MKPERIAEQRERHAAVWPELLRALEATGWHNYSRFLRDDGMLIGNVRRRAPPDSWAAASSRCERSLRPHSLPGDSSRRRGSALLDLRRPRFMTKSRLFGDDGESRLPKRVLEEGLARARDVARL